MKAKAADFLVYDQESGTYREDPEQAVRDDVEKVECFALVNKNWTQIKNCSLKMYWTKLLASGKKTHGTALVSDN